MFSGPPDARILIVGEAPGAEEERTGQPFQGASGHLLDSILSKAGLLRSSCAVTNVCHHRPPDNNIDEWISSRKTSPFPEWVRVRGKWCDPRVAEGVEKLRELISRVNPSIILAVGNTALWALTGNSGIQKWRGSRLSSPDFPQIIVPTFHPAAALRDMALAPIILMDVKRLVKIFEGEQTPRLYDFTTKPSFDEARRRLDFLYARATLSNEPLVLSADLETRRYHIACMGIAWSATEAICIPFLKTTGDSCFFYSEEEETSLVSQIQKLLLHPNIHWIGQNFLYDCQYFYRFWGVIPRICWDTMIGHHAIYPNMRKGLDFLSSMYAHDHIYWKDEIKEWDPELGEDQFWIYNCKDACITWEIWPEIVAEHLQHADTSHFYFQQSLFHPILRMMNRGIALDTVQRAELKKSLLAAALERQEALTFMAGHDLNPRSSTQLRKFFYDDLKCKGIRSLSTGEITLNSDALQQIADRYPGLARICQTIIELRSIGVFLSTFINADLDSDGRMRCSFAVAGPTTFRFSSRENAFGSGMNLQNIPDGSKEKTAAAGLPNIRKLFIPDSNYTFFDIDLDRADLQVVVWEADDRDLKYALKNSLDLHCVNAVAIFDLKGFPLDELREDHPNYWDHRGRIGKEKRQKAKMGVHATNYGVGDYKLAASLGISVHEASLFRARWFGAHPGIRKWHLDVEAQAGKRGYIENRFRARLPILGRLDLPDALAWIPQSTVAKVINIGLVRIDAAEQAGETSSELLLQVHDSLGGQFLIAKTEKEVAFLKQATRVTIPYDDPLIIPTGVKLSTRSWGDCK